MKPFDTYRDNLAYTARKKENLEKLQDAQFAQMADSALQLWRNRADTDRVAALYLTGDPMAEPDELLTDTASLCTPVFARFCRHFAGNLSVFGLLENEKNQPEDITDAFSDSLWNEDSSQTELPSGNSRTAYMQNSYTDKAWRRFSETVSDMTAEYFTSYPAVCEEVYNARCRYCILPLYTSADGQLVSFRKLIGKYDLKICLETEVELADESVMRFALLRRRLLTGSEDHMPACMELSAVLPENGSAGDLIAACEALGAAVTAVYTIPLAYGDRMQEFCLELDLTKADLAGLSVFLEASQLRYTVVGLYDIV